MTQMSTEEAIELLQRAERLDNRGDSISQGLAGNIRDRIFRMRKENPGIFDERIRPFVPVGYEVYPIAERR